MTKSFLCSKKCIDTIASMIRKTGVTLNISICISFMYNELDMGERSSPAL
jgi:hypothetical protein